MDELQNRWELYRHSDRAAVDIGLMLLKTAVLVNAGALVAILAFLGTTASADDQKASCVVRASYAFVAGLGFAIVGACVAYVYQSYMTYREGLLINQLYATGPGPSVIVSRVRVIIAIMMVLSVIASFAAFAIGAVRVANALEF
jgi:hypothetical protein